jgi:hypothetical protein
MPKERSINKSLKARKKIYLYRFLEIYRVEKEINPVNTL